MENQQEQNNKVEQDTDQNQKSLVQKIGLFFLEVIKVVVLASITVFVVRHFVFKPFVVKGRSMEPNFYEHDYLIIDQVSYRFRKPQRGEVVVFQPPTNKDEYYLKRVIGLPGERVRIEDGKVIVCDVSCEVLKESYIDGSDIKKHSSYSVTLGNEQYFVLGDNRDNSSDSRIFGPIDRDSIVGKAWFRGYPVSRISEFDAPTYTNIKSSDK